MSNLLQKVISVLLSMATLCALLCFNSFAVDEDSPPSKVVYGDVDGNGSINSNDALRVLLCSVGEVDFSESELLAADVNGDGVANSADALNILEYSVGAIDRFKVEDQNKLYDPEQGLTELGVAIDAVSSRLPSYVLREKVVDKADEVKLSGNALSVLTQSQISELEQGIKDDHNKNRVYTTIVKQSTAVSAEKMLEDAFKDFAIADFKSVTVAVNESGNKIINISFKDEKNPSTGSPIVKLLGMESYSEAKDELSKSDFSGLSVKVESLNLWYKNATLSCEFNSDTAELVELSWLLETVSEAKVSTSYLLSSFSVELKLSGERGETFNGFGY